MHCPLYQKHHWGHDATKCGVVVLMGIAIRLATAAQASKGIDWSLAIPLISTISTTIIAFTALHLGRAVWTRADGICIALGTLAIILWAITKEPLTALILSMLADISVTAPTIIKTYQDPTSEPATLWVIYVIAVTMELVATQQYTIYNLLFPVYTVLGATIITALALRGRFKQSI